jgi:hypothetical protein
LTTSTILATLILDLLLSDDADGLGYVGSGVSVLVADRVEGVR